MERPTSTRANIPPWERSNIAQVPYMDATSVSLSCAKREALPDLRAAQSKTTPRRPDNLNACAPKCDVSYQTFSASSSTCDPDRVNTPMTAPLFHSQPVPIPAGPKTEPNLPCFALPPKSNRTTHPPSTYEARLLPPKGVNTPPTPPYGEASSYRFPSSKGLPKTPNMPPTPPPASSNWDTVVDSAPGSKRKCTCQHRKRPSRIARFKSAVKEFFHHDSDTESELEHIEIVHWTDQ